jgi:AsmA-like C-terminal region/AsmA family
MAATTPAQVMTPQRLVRKLLFGLLGLVGFSLLMLVMLPYIVSLDSIKGQIVAHIEAALQRQVDVGAVRLQLLSGLGVGLEDVTIDNPPGWQQPYLMKAGRLSVKVAWRPLLRRQVEITKLLLSDGEIIIERDAQGRLNFPDLAVSTPKSTETLPAQAHRSTDAEGTQARSNALAALSVSDMTLQKMQITFADRMIIPGQETITALRNVQLQLHDVALGTPIPIDLMATMSTDDSQNIRVHGRVGPIPENVVVESVPLNIHLLATDVHLDQFTPYLGANVPLSQGRLGADITVEGHIDRSLHITSTLSLADAMLRAGSMRDALRALPTLTSTQDITVDLLTGQAELTDVVINVSGVQATIKGMVHKLTTTPELDLRLATNAFAPGALLSQFPDVGSMLPAPTDLRGTVQLQATLTGTPHDLHSEAQVDLHEIALRSGVFSGGAQGSGGVLLETDQANVRLVVHAVNTDAPRVHIDAGVQRLSFDQQGTHTPTSIPDLQSAPTTETPPSTPMLPPVTLNGRVSIAEGRLRKLNFQQMTADFNLFKGILKTTHQMTLYGGSYQGAMQVDLAPSEPSYTLDAKFAGLDVGQLVNALTPAKNVLLGIVDTDMRLVGQGMTWDVINKTLSGNGSVKITEAQLITFDLLPKLGQLLREVGGLVGVTISKAWQQYDFRTIEGDWRLHQGKILTDRLRLRGEGVEALLKGYVGLDQSIEYEGNLFLPAQSIARRGAPTLFHQDEAGRVVVPFAVKGTVTEPRISISEKALVNLAQEELADTVRKRLGDKIEGIFGKPSARDQQSQESDQTSQETGDQPQRQNLPGKILRELFRR